VAAQSTTVLPSEIVAEPSDQFYGDRTYRARDPEGHLWTFSQPVRVVSREDAEKASGLKIESAISNARAVLKLRDEFRTFDAYLWRFVDGKPVRNYPRAMSELPARTAVSDALSKDLGKRGFRFVGPTICYAFMQATGMVNDHVTTCFRYSTRRSRRT